MQPKIAIGCPVRNRAWVLPEYLQAIHDASVRYDQDEPSIFLFLENDSTDDTFAVIRDAFEGQDNCIIEYISTNVEHWNRGDYAHNQYANLANVRNQFLEMFLRTDADFLLSVDSDVIVPPDIVTRLLNTMLILKEDYDKKSIIGAAISNIPNKPLDGEAPGNFLKLSGVITGMKLGEDSDERFDYETPIGSYHHAPYPMHGLHEVDLIGAVYLIPRQAIVDGCRYAPHGQGEDAPFCMAAQRKGYRLFVDMDVKCEHRMNKY